MKKISLFALALTTSLAMYAQNETVTKMAVKPRFGIKAGANLAKLRPQSYPTGIDLETNTHTTLHAGFLVNLPLGTGGFALQPEVLYNGQGSKMNLKTTTPATSQKFEQDMKFLTVPVMFQWKSTGGFFVETGPQIGFLLKAKVEGDGISQDEEENDDSYENFEFSWGAGLGYMSRIGLGIGARYNHGISNLLKGETGGNNGGNEAELKSSVINIGLFYHFGAAK